MRTVFLAFVTLLFQLNLTVASKCKVRPLPKLTNGFVRVRKGVLHFTCRPGFDLEGHAKVKCHDFLKVPQCVPIQGDEEAKGEGCKDEEEGEGAGGPRPGLGVWGALHPPQQLP